MSDGANIVQISDVLTDAKVFEGDFGSDSANDQLIFNVGDDSNYTTFNSSGAVIGGQTTFTFNKVRGFDLASSEDRFGIYGDSNLAARNKVVSGSSSALGLRLTDGTVYEDLLQPLDATTAASSVQVMNNIAAVLQYGVSGNSGYGKDGVADFVYIAYGRPLLKGRLLPHMFSGFSAGDFASEVHSTKARFLSKLWQRLLELQRAITTAQCHIRFTGYYQPIWLIRLA